MGLCYQVHQQLMNQVIEEIGNYRILKSQAVGVGATGCVYFGQNKEGLKVAVKSIDIKKITKSIEKQIENEIKNLTSLQSPFIVKLYDYFRSGEHIYMVLEYCEDGDLKHYLDRNKKSEGLSEAEALTFMRHLMHGYGALLTKHIIHRDIKPANILLKQGVAKLSDFGFSRVVEDPNKTQKLTLLGTPLYTAPEILANNDFSNKCDVWSMGIVFYEMLHGKTPWTGTDLENLKFNIEKRKLEFKANLNPAIKQLIFRMLILQPKQRASWEELFHHPLFARQADLNLPKQKTEASFAEVKNFLQEYLRAFLVKSYLLLDMEAEVNFAPNEKPLGMTDKSKDELETEGEVHQLTHRRNVGFLHLYVLAMYNKNLPLVPKEVNTFMEFEYGLIRKTYDIIKKVCEDFEINNQLGRPRWLEYKKTPQYAELKTLLAKDYYLAKALYRSCRLEIEARINNKTILPETKRYMQKFDDNFEKVFEKAMEINKQHLLTSNRGVCSLLADYISSYILHTKNLLENNQIDFSYFYEGREKEYGLD